MPPSEIVKLAVQPGESAFLVEARSNVGTIAFGTTEVRGHLRGALHGTEVDLSEPPSTSLVLPVNSLTSGNALYDAEIHRRLNAQRYPDITAELHSALALGEERFSVYGDLTIHDKPRPQHGTVEINTTRASETRPTIRMVVTGSMIVDIRDFDVELPSALMLQIFPEATVSFRVTAVSDDFEEGDS